MSINNEQLLNSTFWHYIKYNQSPRKECRPKALILSSFHTLQSHTLHYIAPFIHKAAMQPYKAYKWLLQLSVLVLNLFSLRIRHGKHIQLRKPRNRLCKKLPSTPLFAQVIWHKRFLLGKLFFYCYCYSW